MATVQLGLIGSGIGRSSAPRLHEEAGRLCGLDVAYALRPLDEATPAALVRAVERCIADGLTAINVTHPFKELAARLVRPADAVVETLAAINTIRFAGAGSHAGFNTDHSGFLAAFRARFGDADPGVVGIAGAGGVGRPVAFALASMGARTIRVFDPDGARARRLARDVRAAVASCDARASATVDDVAAGADGLVNCSPLGMHQYPGTAIAPALLDGARWAFDAVYTPRETPFLASARAAGLDVLGGWELFFHQGVDAFEIFTGVRVDAVRLRRALERAP